MNLFSTNILPHFTWERYQYISVNGVFAMLAVVAFFVIIHKIISKKPLEFPVNDKLELEQYTFGFEETHVDVRKISKTRRITAYMIAVIIIVTPLSDLLPGLSV